MASSSAEIAKKFEERDRVTAQNLRPKTFERCEVLCQNMIYMNVYTSYIHLFQIEFKDEFSTI
jgi:hypothetical protein